MDSKRIIWLFAAVGSAIGSVVPLLWGASELSFSSIILGGAGAIAGMYVGFKLSR